MTVTLPNPLSYSDGWTLVFPVHNLGDYDVNGRIVSFLDAGNNDNTVGFTATLHIQDGSPGTAASPAVPLSLYRNSAAVWEDFGNTDDFRPPNDTNIFVLSWDSAAKVLRGSDCRNGVMTRSATALHALFAPFNLSFGGVVAQVAGAQYTLPADVRVWNGHTHTEAEILLIGLADRKSVV